MIRLLPLAALLALVLPTSAQSVPDWATPSAPAAAPPTSAASPPGTPGSGPPTQSVPLDGGLGLLALAGGAYAARRLRARR